MIANANRGTPIHLLWTREEDFIGTTYRAMSVARLRAGLDADGWPIALDVRIGMQEGGVGQSANEFYRESFIDELAHAAGRDPYLYRRELLARTNLPFKDDMIKALAMADAIAGG